MFYQHLLIFRDNLKKLIDYLLCHRTKYFQYLSKRIIFLLIMLCYYFNNNLINWKIEDLVQEKKISCNIYTIIQNT